MKQGNTTENDKYDNETETSRVSEDSSWGKIAADHLDAEEMIQ